MVEVRHKDITPGLLFAFAPEPSPLPKTIPDLYDDVPEGVWLVIGSQWVQKMSGGFWEYLLLGPGPVLEWHMVHHIYKVVDPKKH